MDASRTVFTETKRDGLSHALPPSPSRTPRDPYRTHSPPTTSLSSHSHSSHHLSFSFSQGGYHPSMGYYNAPNMVPAGPMSVEAMMYGMNGVSPGAVNGAGYVDYEQMYRELQLRMYQQQQHAMARGLQHHQQHQPPLPPPGARATTRAGPPGAGPGAQTSPGQGHNQDGSIPHLPLTQEALYQYQQMQMRLGGYHDDLAGGGMGTWEEGEEEDGSIATDGSKQSVARRRHARRRRQLARLAQDKAEWEQRSRQMEAALLEKGKGSVLGGGGDGAADESELSPALFADFRKALAHALLITEEALEQESLSPNSDVDGDGDPERRTHGSDELASRLIDELRDIESSEGGTGGRVSLDDGYGQDSSETNNGPPRRSRSSFERRRASFLSSDAPAVRSVSFQNFLGSFTRDAESGFMSSTSAKSAFDDRVVGMEAVVALEHGLLKAQASGIFSRGELLITAVSTKDMLTCYAGGGCVDVLGATSLDLLHTSLLDGIHVEDVRNLVFAFHLFPTILPEVINTAARRTRQAGDDTESGMEKDRRWDKERAKVRANAEATDADGMLPLPDAAHLLPHGYLRRRLADGSGGFVAVERLGGMIISHDTAAVVREEDARKQSAAAEESGLFGAPNDGEAEADDENKDDTPPEPRTHALSSLERLPKRTDQVRARELELRDAGISALGPRKSCDGGQTQSERTRKPARPFSLDETSTTPSSVPRGGLADISETKKSQFASTTATRSFAPATERPFPGSGRYLRRDENAVSASGSTNSSASGDHSTMNKYHPSNKVDAKPEHQAACRSAVSAPSSRGLSGEQTLSPAASSFVAASAPSASAGARQPPPPPGAPPSSTVQAAARVRLERDLAKDAKDSNESKPVGTSIRTDEPEKDLSSMKATTADGVVLNKYHPSKKVTLVPGAAHRDRVRPFGRLKSDDSRTTEAELSSLVAHCVRHTEKAYVPRSGNVGGGADLANGTIAEELPEGIKDVLRRLTGETFSEHTILVTIERVRGIGGNAGSEARHNAQMMVVSKLLNDLATRRHKAMSTAAAA